ncbi:MAG: MFS transporter [Stagnimonas sp.]|nr:MFS transporter [Stagnimonas sp.]
MRALSSRSKTVAAIGFGQMLAWGSSYYLAAILAPLMARQFGLPAVAVFGMFSAALLVSAVLGPFAGRRVDRLGGRRVLQNSNVLFAIAHLVLAFAQGPVTLALGWLLLGVAMPFGLYDAAFGTLVRLYREDARRSIVAVTLIAGFASSVAWPLTHFVEVHSSWRTACALWALLHLTVGLALHRYGVPNVIAAASHATHSTASPTALKPKVMWLLAAIFAATGFVFAALAAHLPRVLEAAGATTTAAVAAASLVGVFQVGGRVLDAAWLKRLHPFTSAKLATVLHPVGAALLLLLGAPLIAVFTALHGAGVGLMTIVKGTLPLALFGPAGFGQRAGLLEAPSRVMQALAPVLFSLLLDGLGGQVVWITGGLSLAAFAGLWWVQRLTHTPVAAPLRTDPVPDPLPTSVPDPNSG